MPFFRRSGPVIAAALAVASAGTLAAGPQQSARGSKEQHVLVAVSGKNDVPVTDLSATDFVVREDGVAREVIRVSRAEAPQQIALLVDDSQAANGLVSELRQAAQTFIDQVLASNPDTSIALGTFGERPTMLVDYTNSSIVLRKGIEKIFPRTGGGSYLLEGLIEVAKNMKKKEMPRPAIVVFSVEDGPEFSGDRHDRVADALKDAGASLWTIVMPARGSVSLTDEGRERGLVLGDVATQSGGGTRSVLSKQALNGAFKGMADLLLAQFDVTYSHPDTLIPPAKREVTVKRQGLHVWSSRWAGR